MKRGNYSVWRSVIRSPLSLVAAVILVVLLTRGAWNMYMKAGVSSDKLAQAESELLKLEARQKDLSAQVALLSTDEGVESQLRTKYPAVMEGESVAVIIDDQISATTTGVATTTARVTWWWRLLHAFGL